MSKTILFQDTTHRQTDTLSVNGMATQPQDSALRPVPVSSLSLDSIEKQMMAAERRLEQIDSAEQKKSFTPQPPPPSPRVLPTYLDSSDLIIRSTLPTDHSLQRIIQDLTKTSRQTFPATTTSDKIFIAPSEQPHFSITVPEKPRIREYQAMTLKESWMFPVLLSALLLIFWVRIVYGRMLNKTLVSLWNRKAATTLIISRSSLYQRMSAILFVNFLVTGTLFIYLALKHYSLYVGTCSTGKLFLYFIIILTGFLVYGWITTWLTGIIANVGDKIKESFQYTVLFYHNIGIYLFPLVLLIPYTTPAITSLLIEAGFALIAGFYFLRLFWLIYSFIAYKFSLFYLFLYLCALEILPLLLFVRLIFK